MVTNQLGALLDGLRSRSEVVTIDGETCNLRPCGVFVAFDPGYAGHSALPESLKAHFRPIHMVKVCVSGVCVARVCVTTKLTIVTLTLTLTLIPAKPEYKAIVELQLTGFEFGDTLSSKVPALMTCLQEFLSSQPHYDFGA